jgi:hypothetical protein
LILHQVKSGNSAQKKFHWRPVASTCSDPIDLQRFVATKAMGYRTFWRYRFLSAAQAQLQSVGLRPIVAGLCNPLDSGA